MKRKGMGFEVPGKKVYLLGGCGWCEDATDEVYSYDASLNAWGEASPLSTASVNGTWQHAESDMVSGWRGPAVVIGGTLCVGSELRNQADDVGEEAWLTRPPCQLVAIGKKCYVVGKGFDLN